MGLPYATDHYRKAKKLDAICTDAESQALQLKRKLWETVCAYDRYISVLFHLPPGTRGYFTSPLLPAMEDGTVCSMSYNYHLANICPKIYDLELSYLRDGPGVAVDSYEKVLGIDRDLRALSALTPKIWWQEYRTHSAPAKIVQFLHYYLLARVHLRPAFMDDTNDQYAYSRTVCHEACTNAVTRFLDMRPSLPSGFFLARIVDMQALTAATCLLLSSHSPSREQELHDDLRTLHLVHQTIEAFKLISAREDSDTSFPQEAITTLTAVHQLFAQNDPDQDYQTSLQMPLLGEICIRRPGCEPGSPVRDPAFWSFDVTFGRTWL